METSTSAYDTEMTHLLGSSSVLRRAALRNYSGVAINGLCATGRTAPPDAPARAATDRDGVPAPGEALTTTGTTTGTSK